MWVLTKDKTRLYKVSSLWISKMNDGTSDICCTYGFGSNDEFYDKVGTYNTDRATEIFKDMFDNIGKNVKYEMPCE